MKLPSLSLVFPAYNEAANINSTIEAALAVGDEVATESEVIVVNDGSHDQTKALVLKKTALTNRVRLIDHPQNKGYGQTVWDGLQAATKEWVFFSDADLQFDLQEIERLIEFSSQYDIILGARSPRRDPFIRIANAKLWNVFIRLLFGLKVRDIDCAFKLFRRSVLNDLTITSGGATFSTELLLHLQKKGHLFKEVPVSHLPRTAGRQSGNNVKVIVRAFHEVFLLYRRTDLGHPLYRDLFRFGVVGVIVTALDLAALNGAYLVAGLNIYWATFVGFLVGTISGHLLNNWWTYGRLKQSARFQGLSRYAIIGALGLIITEGIMHLLAVEAGLNHNLSKLIAVAVVFFWNFFGNRLWTFRPDSQP